MAQVPFTWIFWFAPILWLGKLELFHWLETYIKKKNNHTKDPIIAKLGNQMKYLSYSLLLAFFPCVEACAQCTVGSITILPIFNRTDASGFDADLLKLPLKPEGSKVYLYDDSVKYYKGKACSVVDMEIGNSDIQIPRMDVPFISTKDILTNRKNDTSLWKCIS